MNRQQVNIYTIQHRQILVAPILLQSVLCLSCWGKTKLAFCLFMKIPLKMAQHIALHICNHFL